MAAESDAPKQPSARWTNQGLEDAGQWPLDAIDKRVKVYGKASVASGAEGESLILDGLSVIELKDTAALNGGEAGFTFSVWFNPYAVGEAQQVIAGKNRYSLGERQWTLTVEPDGKLKAYVQHAGWATVTGKTKLVPGAWHLATLTVDGTQLKLFLDGQNQDVTNLKKPMPASGASITLGGILDGGRRVQTFSGAVDAASYVPRVLSAEEVAQAYHPVATTHPIPKDIVAATPLWDVAAKLPKVLEAKILEGVEFRVIKANEPAKDGFVWLHGVGLGWHKDKLYASFGHNKGEENTPGEQARGRISSDGGKTWGETFTIGAGDSEEHAVSHGVFLSYGGRLWAFHGAFFGHQLTNGAVSKVHTRAYRLNETDGTWEKVGDVIHGGFWPLNNPVRMSDGNWIMPGVRVGDGHPAAVAISHGDDFTKWDLFVIPAHEGLSMWGESAIIVDGPNILNIARFGAKAQALLAVSKDYGRTWEASAPSNLPMATSKPAAGILSNGQRYLVCTTTADSGGRRTPLTIAVGKPGEKTLSRVFVIRPSVFPAGPGDIIDHASLAYPCAVEHEGKLYVGYSNSGGRKGNHNSAELAVIALSKLSAE
jgi:hypothetical protein